MFYLFPFVVSLSEKNAKKCFFPATSSEKELQF